MLVQRNQANLEGNPQPLLEHPLNASSMQTSTERLKTTRSNFRSSLKAAAMPICAAACFPKSLRAKRGSRKTIRLRNSVIRIGINPPTALIVETDMTETRMVIDLMRGTTKMIASTIVIPHTKDARYHDC